MPVSSMPVFLHRARPLLSLFFIASALTCLAEHWPLDAVNSQIDVIGLAKQASGANSTSLVLDGMSLIELKATAAGLLSTGQRYLVCTTTADSGARRSPLTIAVSEPGKHVFSKVFIVRPSIFPQGPGDVADNAPLSYPCAIEHDGKLYIGYSNGGGRRGNHNSAELAVIPIEKLK
jgi:hypothetical protein